MKNKAIILTSVALMLLILMPVNVFRASAAVTNPGVLVAERIGEPMYADPCFQYDTASLEMLMNIYEPLIFFNGTSVEKFIGIVADSWYGQIISVTDPITGQAYKQKWVFHIRPGVYFQSSDEVTVPGEGDLLTAADVEYSFERNMVVDSSLGGELLIWGALGLGGAADMADPLFGAKIDFAVQSDPVANTVTFYLVSPFEPFLQIVAQMYGAIFSKTWSISPLIAGHSANWDGVWPDWTLPSGSGDNNPQNYTRWHIYHDTDNSPLEVVDPSSPGPHLDFILGTGPYMFNYWNKGDGGQYSLIKNPNYWGGWSSPAHVDEYLSIYISSWETRKADFLTGACDICDVPRMYMDQVLNAPGIRCLKDVPTLAVDAAFLNQAISATSTYCGTMPPNGTFTQFGFPQDGFSDLKLRKAFRALFPYADYLLAAFLGEATHPATCVIPGLAYYDPSIATPTYDRALAIKLLKEAWGGTEASPGPLWTGGFLMDFYYNTGNEARRLACEMLAAEFDSINAEFGTKFYGVVTAGPWSGYSALWRGLVLPFYIVGWAVDYPDADDFVTPFMQDTFGTFAKYQGIVNATIDDWIAKGIATIVPSERQGNYTLLQQAYVDNCYSFTLDQATGRRWERDWVQGWFFNSIYSLFMTYAYYLYKEDAATVRRDIRIVETSAIFEAKITGGYDFKIHKVVQNNGAVPEWVDVYIIITQWHEGQTDYHITTVKVAAWLIPSQTLTVDTLIHKSCVNIVTLYYEYVEISDWTPMIIDWAPGDNTDTPTTILGTDRGGIARVLPNPHKAGDLGVLPAPTGFWSFDGACNYKDAGLFRYGYVTAFHELTDFNGDNVCNYKDAGFFRKAYLGV